MNDAASRKRDAVSAGIAAKALENARQDTSVAAENALRAAIQSAYIDVMKDSLDRSIKRAEYLSAAAGAIATTYTGLLGLIYSAKDRPLVVWAFAPAVFLSCALVLGVVYVGFIRRSTVEGPLIPTGAEDDVAEKRLDDFINWVGNGIWQRSWALRAAVISLGVGVAMMPLAFVSLPDQQRQIIALGGLVTILISPAVDLVLWAVRKIWPNSKRGISNPLVGFPEGF